MKRSEFWNRLFNGGGNAGRPAKRKGISVFVGTALIAVITIVLAACGGATSNGGGTPADSVPAAPTLAEPSIGETAVALTWDLSSPGYTSGDGTEATITQYTLFYDEASKYDNTPAAAAADFAAVYTQAQKQVIDMSNGASNVFTVTGLNAATKYYFALRTENVNGLSALSDVKEVETAAADSGAVPNAAPGQVGNVSTVKKDGEVTVSWAAPSELGKITGTDGTQGDGVITQYTVYYTADGTDKVSYLAGPKVESMVFTTPDAEGNAVTSGTISGLENFKTYYFAVTASNAFAEGPGYPGSGPDVSATPSPEDVGPGAPTDVTVTAGDTKVLVRWKAPADPGVSGGGIGNITKYKIYYSATETDLDDLTTLTPTEVNDGNAVSVEIDSLANDTEYFFVVVAGNETKDGSTSDKVSATPVADAKYGTVPGAPTVGEATVGAASVTVNWTASTDTGLKEDGATADELSGFTVYYSTVSSFTPASAEGQKEVADNTATNVVVDGLAGDTLYYFIVTASNATGESAASESASAVADYSDAESVSKVAADLSSSFSILQTRGAILTQEIATEYFQGYTGEYDTSVAWESSGDAVAIDKDSGAWTVTRPSGDGATDASITLMATITKGEAKETVTTTVTVPKVADADLDALTDDEFAIELSIANPVDDGGIDKIEIGSKEGAEQVATALSSGSLGLKAATSRDPDREFEWKIVVIDGVVETVSDKFQIDEDGKISIIAGMITTADTAFKLRAVSTGISYTANTYKEVDLLLKVNAITLSPELLTITVEDKTVTAGEAVSHTATITSDLTAGTDYDLSIDKAGTAVDAVSIDDGGSITIANTIATTDAGTYTVTATGKGNYEGTITKDFVLTVQNEYTVSYELNGGDGTAPAAVPVIDGATIETAPVAPTKTGYAFDGWYTAVTEGTKFIFGAAGTGTEVTASITLYAQWTINEYTVSYDNNSGTGSATASTVNYGATIASAPTSISRTGYTLSSWNTQADGNGDAFTFGTTTVTEDITLYAQWTINQYTVSYDNNSGTGSATASTVNYGATIASAPTSISRTGYTLSSWNTQADGNGDAFTFGTTTVTEDITLYAQWTINQYTVSYDNNSGTGSATASTVNYGATIASAPTSISRTGYTLSSWNTQADGNGDAFTFGTTTVTEDITLYAQWTINQYTVSYDNNSGTGSATASTVNYGATIASAPTSISRTGYTLSSWNTQADGNGDAFTFGTTTVTEDITLYAQWTINQYTVTYDNNSGTGSATASTVNYGATIASAPTSISRTGYTLSSWNTQADGNGDAFTFGTTTVTEDITLYAQWTINQYTVSYDNNSGTGSATASTVNYGATIASAPTSISRTGYTLSSWNTQADGNGDAFTFGTTTVTEDITLYAQWTINQYTVTYDNNSGTGSATASTVNYGATIASAPTSISRTGYTLSSWNTQADGNGDAFTFGTTTVTEDITLYAQWTDNWNVANIGYTAPAQNPAFTVDIAATNLATLSFSETVLTIGTDFEVYLVKGPGESDPNDHVTLSTSGVIGVTADIAATDAGAYTFKVSGIGDYAQRSALTDPAFIFTLASN